MFNSLFEQSYIQDGHNHLETLTFFNDNPSNDSISSSSINLFESEPAEGINLITQNNEERDRAEIEEHNSSEVLSPQQNSTINDTNNLINNTNNIDENCPQNFLQKKRKSSTKEETKTSDNNQKKKYGRKKESEKDKGIHKKDSEDNIVNKIKGWVFHFIRYIISKYSGGNIKINKLKNSHKSNLKKEDNMKLFKDKIKDILCREEISSKYSTLDRYENRHIVEKIMNGEEKNEIIIKILDLTYEEVFILFRRKLKCENDKNKLEEILKKFDGLNFLNDNTDYNNNKPIEDADFFIKNLKGEKDGGEEYKNKVRFRVCNYKNWFSEKIKAIKKDFSD